MENYRFFFFKKIKQKKVLQRIEMVRVKFQLIEIKKKTHQEHFVWLENRMTSVFVSRKDGKLLSLPFTLP